MITALRIIKEKKQAETLKGYSIDHYLPPSKSSCVLATGRSAINHLINKIGFSKKDSVLLPAYVAEGILQPFIKSKIPIKFYKLDQNLFPDTKDISAVLEKDQSIKLCIVIHSFGFEAPINPLIELLIKKNVLLLEDCAQGIFSCYGENNKPFGGKGNFALYSLNKFLPVFDGAILLSHVNNINVSIKENQSELDIRAINAYKRHLQINKSIFDCEDQEKIKLLVKESAIQYNIYYTYINTNCDNHKISTLSKEIIETFDYDFLIKRRKENTNIIYNNFDSKLFELFFENTHENIIPMAIPVIIKDGLSDKVFRVMYEKGVLLAKQEDRWNFLSMTDNQNKFLIEQYFIDNHALVPINEFINEEKMHFIVEQLNLISLN